MLSLSLVILSRHNADASSGLAVVPENGHQGWHHHRHHHQTHMPRNDAAAPGHVCPGIRIHAIDIVQPPGIGISPIADMDAHQTIVTAALAAKSSAETPKKARRDAALETIGIALCHSGGVPPPTLPVVQPLPQI